MTRVTIFHSPRYDIISYGNGLSYTIHDNEAKVSAFVQGDDAIEFRAEFDAWPGDYNDFCDEQIAIRE
jgi:hypothetical protein